MRGFLPRVLQVQLEVRVGRYGAHREAVALQVGGPHRNFSWYFCPESRMRSVASEPVESVMNGQSAGSNCRGVDDHPLLASNLLGVGGCERVQVERLRYAVGAIGGAEAVLPVVHPQLVAE